MVTHRLSWAVVVGTLLASVSAGAAEPPKPDAPKADAPKADAPKADAPKADAPKADAPKADAPKADAPKADAPKAEPAGETDDGEPRVHHAPIASRPEGEDILLAATLAHPEKIRRVVVAYRTRTGWKEAELRRSATGSYAAKIPAADVTAPGLAYTLEIETTAGTRIAAFATRETPHEIRVATSGEAEREAALLRRLEGRRSVVTTSFDYARFGATKGTITSADGKSVEGISVSDQYWRAEAGYTYRMLGVVDEFGIRVGVVRGTSAVPNAKTRADNEVGLNYGSPHVRFRATDWLHLDATALTSVTEVGFSLGAGAAVLVGDPRGGHFTMGFESVRTFGTRAYTRLDLVVNDRVTLAPIVEVTDMPHAEHTGVRLVLETQVAMGGGFSLAARGGYQARNAASGGPGAGMSVSYAF